MKEIYAHLTSDSGMQAANSSRLLAIFENIPDNRFASVAVMPSVAVMAKLKAKIKVMIEQDSKKGRH